MIIHTKSLLILIFMFSDVWIGLFNPTAWGITNVEVLAHFFMLTVHVPKTTLVSLCYIVIYINLTAFHSPRLYQNSTHLI